MESSNQKTYQRIVSALHKNNAKTIGTIGISLQGSRISSQTKTSSGTCNTTKQNYELIRLGSRYDGGYLVDKNSIYESEFLLSGGIFYDFKFENDYIDLTNNDIYCYDHIINPSKFFLLWTLILIKRFILREKKERILKAKKNVIKPFTFLKFIKKKEVNYEKKGIGYDSKDIYSLDTILKKISIKKKFFLKIDIEGDEYKILDQIIKNSENLTGLVIEFHDVSRNIKMIESFIQKLPLILIYVRANNAGEVNSDNDPEIIELTFSKHAIPKNDYEFSKHNLDFPNNPYKREITLKFSE